MVQGIGLGAGVIAYDGSPFYPHPKVLWDVVEKYK
jgi:acyl-coenzyme A synthetase/AMP-(fatty) acid ligase